MALTELYVQFSLQLFLKHKRQKNVAHFSDLKVDVCVSPVYSFCYHVSWTTVVSSWQEVGMEIYGRGTEVYTFCYHASWTAAVSYY